ncbi:Sugar carrier protein like [Quillaja saponaria]|uniref:Sugar carrier protein like n=1 Tax=Quillaja saponaria TaxID=32244 RepID=A0AAD7PY22_QUISA|nr:Sugar carrier protein like [Quillaja saponaria]
MARGFVNGIGGAPNGFKKEYPGKLTWYVICTCIAAAFGGLIFGYDIGISGGVTSMDSFLKKFFPSVYRKEISENSTNQYCTFDSATLTMFTSSLYLAALVASFVAAWMTKKFGRKWSMVTGGLIFMVGAILNLLAQNVAMLIIGRILLGIGVGFSIQSVPVYVSEMAPYNHRGKLNQVFQLSITIGILIANLVNFVTPKIFKNGDGAWRASLGFAIVPALVVMVSALFLPNSPNSMIEQGKTEEAKATLRRIRGFSDEQVKPEFDDLVAASEAARAVKRPWKNIRERQYRPQLVMSILIPTFQQLTGINVVMFYAPVLFKTIGFGGNASLLSAVITGIINVAATSVAIFGTDKWGRRAFFLEGGIQMLIFQGLVAAFIGWKFGVTGEVSDLPKWYAILLVVFICIFVSGFAWSWGPLGWLVPSEIFPLEIRSAAQSINVSVNMLFTFIIAQAFLPGLCHLKFGLFIVFAFFVAVMTLFIAFFLPETQNIPIEEMTQVWRKHWYWRTFVPQQRLQV